MTVKALPCTKAAGPQSATQLVRPPLPQWKAFAAGVLAAILSCSLAQSAPDAELTEKARRAVERAAAYFKHTLSVDGAYVWSYSADLSERRGEGLAEAGTGWVEPPGTPGVGAAFLRVYEITGDRQWVDAARESGAALVGSQLLSGGWAQMFETDPARRQRWCYLRDGATPDSCKAIKEHKLKNRSVMDDNTTQGALTFLIWLDQVLAGSDAAIREAIDIGLESLIRAQYPNGSWPQELDRGFRRREITSAWRSAFPPSWSREWVKPEAPAYYVLNDHLVRDTIRLLLLAERIYDRPEFLAAAMRAGDFLLAAQLPSPQRGWAQTYDSDLFPVWGRRFEPPAVASSETAGSVDALLQLYGRTNKDRYLEGALDGAAWLRSARLPDGSWSRFYELRTDRPLYVDNEERLTFNAQNLLSHYELKGVFDIPATLSLAERVAAGGADVERAIWPTQIDSWSEEEVQQKVRALVELQDREGRWMEDGWVNSQTFIDAAFAVGRYLEN